MSVSDSPGCVRESGDTRLLVPALTAWGATWLVTSGQAWAWICVLVASGVAWCCWWRWRSLIAAVVLIVALGSAGSVGLRIGQQQASIVHELGRNGDVATVQLRITGGAELRDSQGTRSSMWRANGEVTTVFARGEQWRTRSSVCVIATGARAEQWQAVDIGDLVQTEARFLDVDPDRPEVACVKALGPPQLLAGPGALTSAVRMVRDGLRNAVAGLPASQRALVPALVVGDTSRMSEELDEQFKTNGLTHLTAVSGSNLTLLLTFVLAIAGRAGLRGWWQRGFAALTVVWFVLLCQAEPSVVRAAAMGIAGVAALGLGGRAAGLRLLNVTVITLMFADPWLARSWGFALSVTASAGIIWWARRWSTAWQRIVPCWLAESLAVPLAAQLATQPLVVALSGQVSVVCLLANAVAGPFVGPATIMGFLAAGFAVVWMPAARVCGAIAGLSAQMLCWVAELGCLFPGAVVRWPAGLLGVVLSVLGCWGAAVVVPRMAGHRWGLTAMTLLIVVMLVRPVNPWGWPPDRWSLVACDVGQGDGIVLRAGSTAAVVVDTGPSPQMMGQCLTSLGIRDIPLLVLTHLHADHVGGLDTVLSRFTVGGVLISPAYQSSNTAEGIRRRGLPLVPAQTGQHIQVGRIAIQVLHAGTATVMSTSEVGESAAENDQSIVLRVRVDDLTVLVAGDVEESAQLEIVGRQPDLSATVLLVPHHGSSHQSTTFLQSVNPDISIISVGADNDYGHPAKTTLQRLDSTRIFRTDHHGAIAVGKRGRKVEVTTQRSPG